MFIIEEYDKLLYAIQALSEGYFTKPYLSKALFLNLVFYKS